MKRAQKQQGKPDATQFQALIRTEAQVQNDNERNVGEIEPEYGENDKESWQPPDLQYKNGAACLMPS